jgi:hypothetical protein
MPSKSRASSELICQAIREQRLLAFGYKGQPRVVQPYCYGLATTDSELLRAIQVGGASSSGGFGFGKLWTVADMTDVQVSAEKFVPDDPNYNPNDSAMKRILCRIEK